MKQLTAPASLSVRVITVGVLALNAILYVGAFELPPLLLPAALLSVVVLICYFFWTPVAYELTGDVLTVCFRIGRMRYGPVVRCSPLQTRPGWAIRLFGNGGLFAGSGIFWNRKWGVFRAYVTTSVPAHLLLVETARKKILISPRDAQAFLVAPS